MSVTLDSTNLNTGNYRIHRLLHDHIAEVGIEKDIISRKSGEKILSNNLKPKVITIEGRIIATTNTLEQNIDSFKLLTNVTTGTLDISYNTGTRRYTVTLKNLSIERDYHHIAFANYKAEFLVLDPYGYNTAVSETLSVQALTETTSSWNNTFDGSGEPKPTITYIIDTAGNLLSIQFSNNTTGTQIEIGTAWANSDTLIIDTNNKSVQKNGSDVEFEGVFPRFETGENSITSSFSKNTIEQQQTTVENSRNIGSTFGDNEGAQSFVASGNISIDEIKVYISKNSAVTSNLTVEIQTNSSGLPSGTVVTNGSTTIAKGNISTNGGWATATFSTPPALTSGTKYWLVIRVAPPLDGNDFYSWFQASGNPNSNSDQAYYSMGTWSSNTIYDFAFKIYRQASPSWSIDKKITYTKKYL